MKSILVHLANDEDHRTRLKVGFDLCKRFNAHMTVLYITTPVHIPYGVEGRGASMAFIQEAQDVAHEKSVQLEQELASWCAEQNITYEWERAEGDHLRLLAAEAYYHDLAIVSQSRPHNLEEMLFAELPDHLALVSSGPVMVMPHKCERESVGNRVLVAWKPCAEAARAVHAALPILKAAEHVTVMTADDDPDAHNALDSMAAYLACHGVRCDQRLVALEGMDHHDVILDSTNAINADLIVMGGFSESRMRHLVLGGQNRKILSRTHTPVLMAH